MGTDTPKSEGLWLATKEAWSVFVMFVILVLLVIIGAWAWRNASSVVSNTYNPDQIDRTVWNGNFGGAPQMYRTTPPMTRTGYGMPVPHGPQPYGYGEGYGPGQGTSCPPQLRFNPSTGYCETTFTMPSPRPEGPGWRRSVSDHGWFRVVCIANCPR